MQHMTDVGAFAKEASPQLQIKSATILTRCTPGVKMHCSEDKYLTTSLSLFAPFLIAFVRAAVASLGSSNMSSLTAACQGQTLSEETKTHRNKNHPTSSNETVAVPQLKCSLKPLVPFLLYLYFSTKVFFRIFGGFLGGE